MKDYNLDNTANVINAYSDWLDGKLTDKEYSDIYNAYPDNQKHGKLTNLVFEAYGDLAVYEDGYTDWYSLGE